MQTVPLLSHARRLSRDLATYAGPAQIDFANGNCILARRFRSVISNPPDTEAQRKAVLDLLQAALRVATDSSVSLLRTCANVALYNGLTAGSGDDYPPLAVQP